MNEFEAVILPCAKVRWREDFFCILDRCYVVDTFVEKNEALILPRAIVQGLS